MARTAIATTTVGAGGAASIDFTGIQGVYTDLQIVLSARATSTTAAMTINFNGSATNFTCRYLQGNGSTATSTTNTTFIGNASISTDTASTFGTTSIYISNYAGSTNKSFSVESGSENNATTAYLHLIAGLWSNTAAITQVTLNASNFAQYTTATLYGITKGSGGATVS